MERGVFEHSQQRAEGWPEGEQRALKIRQIVCRVSGGVAISTVCCRGVAGEYVQYEKGSVNL